MYRLVFKKNTVSGGVQNCNAPCISTCTCHSSHVLSLGTAQIKECNMVRLWRRFQLKENPHFRIPCASAFGNQWFEADPLASAKSGGVQVVHFNFDLCAGQSGSRCCPAFAATLSSRRGAVTARPRAVGEPA